MVLTRRHALAAALLAAAGGCRRGAANSASASPTPTPPPAPDYGDGHDGPLTVSQANTIVNVCHPLAAASGSTAHLAAVDGMHAGDRVLVWQVQDAFADVTLTTDAPMTAADLHDAGAFELATIASIDDAAATLALVAPLSASYSSDTNGRRAQACVMPQYSDVVIAAGASIAAPAWTGAAGGLAAFFVNGTLTLDGAIVADAAGFRGGTLQADADVFHVTEYRTMTGDGGGKGESLDGRAFELEGRGDLGNGGGGGNAHNAGGGGGGNGGRGGFGGREYGNPSNAKTQGLPGAPLDASVMLYERLALGGGGGAGQQNNDMGGVGGNGGGLIFVSAQSLAGAGALSANGGDGHDAGDVNDYGDGGGGGGAGGTIRLECAAATFTGAVHARGGKGGNVLRAGQSHGPGGGGGGGSASLCAGVNAADLAGGAHGVNVNNANDPWAATDGEPGH